MWSNTTLLSMKHFNVDGFCSCSNMNSLLSSISHIEGLLIWYNEGSCSYKEISSYSFFCYVLTLFYIYDSIFDSCSGYWDSLLIYPIVDSCYDLNVSFFYCLGSIFTRLFICDNRSECPFINSGWENTIFDESFLDLWNPYMFSCRIKLLILWWRKYFGNTVFSSFSMLWTSNSFSFFVQQIIYSWLSF